MQRAEGYPDSERSSGLDPLLTWVSAALAVIGLLFIVSVSYRPLEEFSLAAVWEAYQVPLRQLLWVLLGAGAYWWASRFRLRRGMGFWLLLGLTAAVLLAVALWGASVHGSSRWFTLFGLSVQPSEFAKPVLILLLATLMSPREGSNRLPPLYQSLGVTLLFGGLIAIEPDLGTALILFALFFTGALVAGYDLRKLGLIALAGLLLAVPGWFFLEDYQRERLTGFIGGEGSDYYQVQQARIAIGSGGLMGKGLFKGSQKSGDYIFGARNDFIFAVIGEETGMIGGLLVLICYYLLVSRLLWLRGGKARPFPRMVASLAGLLIGIQAAVHIAMNLGLMPVTGLPLPLVSYGGSSIIATAFTLGLAQAGS